MKLRNLFAGGAVLLGMAVYSPMMSTAAAATVGSPDSDALIAGYQLIRFDLAECAAIAQHNNMANGSGIVSPDILKISGKICDDAIGYQSKVKNVAKEKGVELPSGLPYYLTARYAGLIRNQGPNLGVHYLNDQISSHEDALNVFQDAAENGKDPEIKAMAAEVIPVVQENLDLLKAALAKN